MTDRYGAARQLPCPDCGSPVQPDREQLCPRCGYPLMFLRGDGGGDARQQAVPRSPNERDDPTSLRPRVDTRQFPAVQQHPPSAAPGQATCRGCGYPNEAVRIRCERCGAELRQASPRARVLHPAPEPAGRRPGGGVPGWLIVLIVLAVLALLVLAATLVWWFSG